MGSGKGTTKRVNASASTKNQYSIVKDNLNGSKPTTFDISASTGIHLTGDLEPNENGDKLLKILLSITRETDKITTILEMKPTDFYNQVKDRIINHSPASKEIELIDGTGRYLYWQNDLKEPDKVEIFTSTPEDFSYGELHTIAKIPISDFNYLCTEMNKIIIPTINVKDKNNKALKDAVAIDVNF